MLRALPRERTHASRPVRLITSLMRSGTSIWAQNARGSSAAWARGRAGRSPARSGRYRAHRASTECRPCGRPETLVHRRYRGRRAGHRDGGPPRAARRHAGAGSGRTPRRSASVSSRKARACSASSSRGSQSVRRARQVFAPSARVPSRRFASWASQLGCSRLGELHPCLLEPLAAAAVGLVGDRRAEIRYGISSPSTAVVRDASSSAIASVSWRVRLPEVSPCTGVELDLAPAPAGQLGQSPRRVEVVRSAKRS